MTAVWIIRRDLFGVNELWSPFDLGEDGLRPANIGRRRSLLYAAIVTQLVTQTAEKRLSVSLRDSVVRRVVPSAEIGRGNLGFAAVRILLAVTQSGEVPRRNPAGRLYWIINAARDRRSPFDDVAIKVWAQVFSVSVADRAAFLRCVARMAEMARTTRRILSSLDDYGTDEILVHMDSVDDILRGFHSIEGKGMREFLEPLSNESFSALGSAANLIDRFKVEPVLDDDEVERLLAQFRDLREEIRDALDLEPAIRRFLISHVQEIVHYLENYSFFGAEPIEAALNQVSGALARNPGLIERMSKSGVVASFCKAVVALDIALNLAANVLALGQDDRKSLPPPASENSPVIIQIVELTGVQLQLPPSTFENASPPESAITTP